ncbi:Uu.00g020800.m01.CDS01 [Anthostomella pinea]|uniref:Uu.00g020800.m01.CDS01 n=1 Tax=Anthostomella pinea TaxID=933095 RepID=A0AAI8VTQ5_9PEZI|nr:Uu.00g020800.m01.CDS01 [Anthostomella pinea]
MRIPCKGIVRFPEERVRYEVATMRYISANTSIPLPKVYHSGTAAENPTGLGPFVIMKYVDHERTMSEALKDPTLNSDEDHVLDPDIGEQKLEFLYGQMANIMLQLSALAFPRIGSLVQDADGRFTVSGRPHPEHELFHVASPSRLFCEDLRPSNVLIDKDLRVVGVIDWEFTYAAPSQCTSDPPWWLLLQRPESWPGGYGPWMEAYKPRLETFLRVLDGEERNMASSSGNVDNAASPSLSRDLQPPLSLQMRESWEKQTFMISYAARNSWVFDFIFWRYLDGRYFGPNEDGDYRARLDLLTQQELEAMEALVKMKMEQREERTLVTLDDDDAAAQLTKFMI